MGRDKDSPLSQEVGAEEAMQRHHSPPATQQTAAQPVTQ